MATVKDVLDRMNAALNTIKNNKEKLNEEQIAEMEELREKVKTGIIEGIKKRSEGIDIDSVSGTIDKLLRKIPKYEKANTGSASSNAQGVEEKPAEMQGDGSEQRKDTVEEASGEEKSETGEKENIAEEEESKEGEQEVAEAEAASGEEKREEIKEENGSSDGTGGTGKVAEEMKPGGAEAEEKQPEMQGDSRKQGEANAKTGEGDDDSSSSSEENSDGKSEEDRTEGEAGVEERTQSEEGKAKGLENKKYYKFKQEALEDDIITIIEFKENEFLVTNYKEETDIKPNRRTEIYNNIKKFSKILTGNITEIELIENEGEIKKYIDKKFIKLDEFEQKKDIKILYDAVSGNTKFYCIDGEQLDENINNIRGVALEDGYLVYNRNKLSDSGSIGTSIKRVYKIICNVDIKKLENSESNMNIKFNILLFNTNKPMNMEEYKEINFQRGITNLEVAKIYECYKTLEVTNKDKIVETIKSALTKYNVETDEDNIIMVLNWIEDGIKFEEKFNKEIKFYILNGENEDNYDKFIKIDESSYLLCSVKMSDISDYFPKLEKILNKNIVELDKIEIKTKEHVINEDVINRVDSLEEFKSRNCCLVSGEKGEVSNGTALKIFKKMREQGYKEIGSIRIMRLIERGESIQTAKLIVKEIYNKWGAQ